MKAVPKPEATPAVAAPNKKKKLLIVIAAALLAGGGGAGWYFLHGKNDGAAHKTTAKRGPPVFVQIEPFTVNLQADDAGDQFLQATFTLQVTNPEQMDLIKTNMPKVRNRLLLLLSGKKASELNTVAGKKQLATEIIAQIRQPFDDKGPQQEVTDVLFTSFIIQ